MKKNTKIEYRDLLWGKFVIDDPVILELLTCKSLIRLQEIDQAGYPKPFFGHSVNSRFEHSVGVYLLLKKFQASIEEQIAGLIHDVSHTAFSHSIDYVLDQGSEASHSYQDSIFSDFVLKSEIPGILQKYSFDTNYILNEKNFPLLETKLPKLCADRIDYSLRNLLAFKIITKKDFDDILNSLKVFERKWVFDTIDMAKKFAFAFKKLNQEYYSGIRSAAMFKSVGQYLSYALKKNYVNMEDFFQTDKFVLEKINKNLKTDSMLQDFWKRLNNGNSFVSDLKKFDEKVYCKSRVVDPLVLENSKIHKLSDVYPEWSRIVESELEPKVHFLRYTD